MAGLHSTNGGIVYRITDTGEVVCENLTMDDLRCFLARNDYPLYDEKSAVNTSRPQRNRGAVLFMQAVESIKHL